MTGRPRLLSHRGIAPRIDPSAWLAPDATVIGDVKIGPASSIWFGTVVRGDVHHIRIGARTNLQDGTVVHVTTDTWPTILGDDVVVGHRAVLHGCEVRDGALIGIGSIVLDGAVVGEGPRWPPAHSFHRGWRCPPARSWSGCPPGCAASSATKSELSTGCCPSATFSCPPAIEKRRRLPGDGAGSLVTVHSRDKELTGSCSRNQ